MALKVLKIMNFKWDKGDILRKLRIKKRITIYDISKSIGIKPSIYSNFEDGECIPQSDQWQKIYEVLNLSIEEINQIESASSRIYKWPSKDLCFVDTGEEIDIRLGG